ncbi:aspartyl-tRNA(Asn)/glutamyl-tRNA(Gln) amidotransferase subunit B [Fistulifera solaris]|jgi:aspartyl-tRNA(Asn)/glutamyl-tRNA(Gln) amidotransferase subunit B|uniref:Glutamyl-tRNA(Gln) amidotransferase subunit B, mitochondrial n=1 Tax=Fistulifera solaris TaxID=1519565 RepID=A0A1Z5JSF1_FISSO|nr:aspartyl-tRNA(Asn)/glutamyl-tRNA(Gln) amidotransferase subunit B [Fistulifera solaris]|eukprot:GAX16963.1 aspartyl-tRNA(Asn)/glutamyl-tRNA(Gln) amidotransferase subunit B [Fistulifera solaris]
MQIKTCFQTQFNQRNARFFSSWKVDPWSGEVRPSKGGPVYQVIVGLEIHAQLNIRDKLFSPAISSGMYGQSSSIYPFDVAVPGKLPLLSAEAVQKAVLVAAALQCDIHTVSRFERKHYTYADLPHSYQITQQRWPLAENGLLECSYMSTPKNKLKDGKVAARKTDSKQPIRCRIQRVQLEQDTGKTTSTTRSQVCTNDSTENDLCATTIKTIYSLVDFSRAGCALVEIVTAPDLRSSLQAASVVHSLRHLLRFTGTCLGRMEDGNLRVDCNVNLQNEEHLRTPRIEIKNLNSIQQVRDAIEFEAVRQAENFEKLVDGVEETRTWDVLKRKTTLIRTKDQAIDYRFLPEPDLPPLVLNENVLGAPTIDLFLLHHLPELPAVAEQRLRSTYQLGEYHAHVIARDPAAIRLFEDAMCFVNNSSLDTQTPLASKTTANLLCNDLFSLVKKAADGQAHATILDDDDEVVSMSHAKINGSQLGEIATMILQERISSTMAKKLLALLFTDEYADRNPSDLAHNQGFRLVTDQEELRELCRAILRDHPEEVAVYKRGGKFIQKMNKLFTGKAMLLSNGNAHPERLQDALSDVLDDVAPGIK